MTRSRFRVLLDQFLAQFFAAESATSDIRFHHTVIWIVAFLMTPGFLLAVQVFPTYQFAVIRLPALIEPLTIALEALFLTYSAIAIGLVGAFVWDSLGFDRRDAMVLGPLPLASGTIILAKLGSFLVLLLGLSLFVNTCAAVIFAMVASGHLGFVAVFRHMLAHLAASISVSAFVFSSMVFVRGGLSLVGSQRFAVGMATAVQFLFVAAMLCFVLLLPYALQMDWRRSDIGLLRVPTAAWVPTTWFVGLYEIVRGSPRPEWVPIAARAAVATLGAVSGAVCISIAGFRRQLRLALTPAASPGPLGGAWIARAIARLLVGRDRVAAATTEFILTTIARNRAQQAPIAINAAVGLTLVAAGLMRSRGDISALMRPRTIVLSIPLILAYWLAIGLRASFFVPSELPASWTFAANAPEPNRGYRSAVRASMIALMGPWLGVLTMAVTAALLGWRAAVWHTAFVLLLVVLLADAVVLTIDHVPFTRPYKPGHAKLKTRWPLYCLSAYGFGYSLARTELAVWNDAAGFAWLLASVGAATAALEIAGWWRASTWSVQPRDEELADDPWNVTVLDIGSVVQRAHVEG